MNYNQKYEVLIIYKKMSEEDYFKFPTKINKKKKNK